MANKEKKKSTEYIFPDEKIHIDFYVNFKRRLGKVNVDFFHFLSYKKYIKVKRILQFLRSIMG